MLSSVAPRRRRAGTQEGCRPSGVMWWYASGSVADAQPRLGVEDVHVAGLGLEVDLVALLRGAATVDAGDERHGAGVLAGGLEQLLLGGAVDVGVGAELLDDVDRDGDAGGVGRQLEVLRTDAERHVLSDTGEVLTRDRHGV